MSPPACFSTRSRRAGERMGSARPGEVPPPRLVPPPPGIPPGPPTIPAPHSRDLEGVRLIGPWFLRAETWPRKPLFGVRQSLRVEGTANALHGIEVGLGEHYRHELFLLLPHAVLAGDRAAGFHAQS